MTPKKKQVEESQWRQVDLHLHTLGSADWGEPDTTFLDWLREVERRGLDIVAITDHNTVSGIQRLRSEVGRLAWLEQGGRLQPEERAALDEYRRLGEKILVLPGFEFTATFGFHILAIFSPETSVRQLELLLLQLNVPPDKLDVGSTEVGATADVLTAYRLIAGAGGLVMAAHANSSNGVAMRNFPFGGQTKIAYTQDPHLHALEVTDLESKGRRTTAQFYNGSKPEYPRRMHCIQGSDAHLLKRHPQDKVQLGIGDRTTEILLPEASFESLLAVFEGNDFSLTRPYRAAKAPFDHVSSAREQGPNIVQSFHESMSRRGGRLHKVLCDVTAFANTKGGTIYVGVSGTRGGVPTGVTNPSEAVSLLRGELQRKTTPPLDVTIDTIETQGKQVLRIVVPEGDDKPYVVDDIKVYVRQEAETSLAVRDEVVQLIRETLVQSAPPVKTSLPAAAPEQPSGQEGPAVQPPTVGVQIVESIERKGVLFHTVKDLRNGTVVRNVTRESARKLWRYAITQQETNPVAADKVKWAGDVGLWQARSRAGKTRYDFVQRLPGGSVEVYYGVTEEGIGEAWQKLLEEEGKS
ncbi:MAG TPA: RNA-binding domain-containing protein [Anaerolineae bacterium]|nr:RNA-binding domain-containing protein [Anaerolineae bacterium]